MRLQTKGEKSFLPRRCFIVEPGLHDAIGHPMQYALAIRECCLRQNLPTYVVANNSAKSRALSRLRPAFPIIEKMTFPVTAAGPGSFFASLLRLDRKFRLGSRDLIIITSCHLNELKGVALYSKVKLNRSACLPRIVMNFHQLFPPGSIPSYSNTFRSQKNWLKRLKEAFSALPLEDSTVSCWTTSSSELNRTFHEISGKRFGLLPFPLIRSRRVLIPKLHRSRFVLLKRPRLAFIGDGRREKGLTLLSRAILDFIPKQSEVSFVIQHANPRGYCAAEARNLEKMVAELSNREDVLVLFGPLSIEAYPGLVHSIDAVILPYDPAHYDRRASMVFAEAASLGKPIIASKGTWMDSEIKKQHASGILFGRNHLDSAADAIHLAKAIQELCGNFAAYATSARANSKYHREINTADNYFSLICSSIGSSEC